MTIRQRPSCDEDHISSTVISIGAPPVLAASATPTASARLRLLRGGAWTAGSGAPPPPRRGPAHRRQHRQAAGAATQAAADKRGVTRLRRHIPRQSAPCRLSLRSRKYHRAGANVEKGQLRNHAPPQTASLFDHGETECFGGLKVDGKLELGRGRHAGQRPSPPNELRSWLISGLSYRTTFNKELWISRFPLYLI